MNKRELEEMLSNDLMEMALDFYNDNRDTFEFLSDLSRTDKLKIIIENALDKLVDEKELCQYCGNDEVEVITYPESGNPFDGYNPPEVHCFCPECKNEW